MGNKTFLSPEYARNDCGEIKQKGAKPFITDTNVLYKGARQNAADNLMTASNHGYTTEYLGAPVIVADGLRGHDTFDITAFDGTRVQLASIIKQADGFIVLSHFKGHILSGVGGALKNLSMGFASRAQKQRMHADVLPSLISDQKCISCGKCIEVCPVSAISLNPVARFNHKICIGCAECLSHCPVNAIKIQWGSVGDAFSKKLMVTAAEVAKLIKGKALYINAMIDITKECDCMGQKLDIITSDTGFCASDDPVALDKACHDIVKESAIKMGDNTFDDIYPSSGIDKSLELAEAFGAGNLTYKFWTKREAFN
jgi:uncharacterized Fe-S center protein